MTKDSQPTSGIMVIIREEDIMVEANIIVDEAITTKVDTNINLQKDQDIGYAIKITISAQNVHTKIGLT